MNFFLVLHTPQHNTPIHTSEAQKQAGARNPYLQQLSQELLAVYNDDDNTDQQDQQQFLDAFGLHVYGMVLKASRQSGSVLPPSSPTPQTVLIQSILQFPYNWSAWLDLADCCTLSPLQQQHQQSQQQYGNNSNTATSQVERDIELLLQPVLGGHYMYHFFCAHLQTTLYQDHALALGIYEKWMEPALFGGSPYMLTQCAVVHYHLRQFTMAKRILQELHADMPYRLDSMDVYSNILYVQEDAVALSGLAHTACQVDKYRAETSVIIGNYYSLKQQRAKAVQAFQRALAVDRTFVSAWTLMGHEYVEWKQTANAMEAYRRAVQVAPSDYRVCFYMFIDCFVFYMLDRHFCYVFPLLL
jgi:anaphase-promoting complex subunit 8